MKFKPFDYQVGMIQHLKDHKQAALFAGMGLGKSAVTLAAYADMIAAGEMTGALIVAPLRVCTITWPDQVAHWGFDLKIANMRTDEGKRAWRDGTADLYVCNFEMLASKTIKGKHYKGILEEFVGQDMPVCTLMIDELSCLKANSQRTKAIIKARKYFKRVHALTGTPSPNSLLDLFYPLKVLDGGERLGKFITHFKNKWFTSDYMGYTWTPKENAHHEINSAIADICLVRRSEQHLEIPSCDIIDCDVTLPAKVMKQYKALERQLVIQIQDKVVDAQSAATLVNKLAQFTAGIVYDEDGSEVHLHTAKHTALKKILAKHQPVLVLTRYRSEMAALLEAFPEAEAFDEKRMDDWRAGKIPCFVANPASLSHGIDGIQDSCSVIVWMSLTYSLEQYEQTNARILRTGQDQNSSIYRIMAASSIDWVIASALENKSEGQSGLMASIGLLQRQSVPTASEPSEKSRDRFDFFSARE